MYRECNLEYSKLKHMLRPHPGSNVACVQHMLAADPG